MYVGAVKCKASAASTLAEKLANFCRTWVKKSKKKKSKKRVGSPRGGAPRVNYYTILVSYRILSFTVSKSLSSVLVTSQFYYYIFRKRKAIYLEINVPWFTSSRVPFYSGFKRLQFALKTVVSGVRPSYLWDSFRESCKPQFFSSVCPFPCNTSYHYKCK